MDEVQKPNNVECYTLSSELFSIEQGVNDLYNPRDDCNYSDSLMHRLITT
jgi:hypothetical protein